MRTVEQFLRKMGACGPARKKYSGPSRAFKKAFVNCYWSYGYWLGTVLFGPTKKVRADNYPELPNYYCPWRRYSIVDSYKMASLFRSKESRVKYWPEVRKRLKELGVKL